MEVDPDYEEKKIEMFKRYLIAQVKSAGWEAGTPASCLRGHRTYRSRLEQWLCAWEGEEGSAGTDNGCIVLLDLAGRTGIGHQDGCLHGAVRNLTLSQESGEDNEGGKTDLRVTCKCNHVNLPCILSCWLTCLCVVHVRTHWIQSCRPYAENQSTLFWWLQEVEGYEGNFQQYLTQVDAQDMLGVRGG